MTAPAQRSAIVNGIDLNRHQGLVRQVAFRVWRRWGQQPRAGVTLDDLLAAGTEGLWRGALRFDHALGYKESTYLLWWIRHDIFRTADNTSRTVRVPVHALLKARRGNRVPLPALSLDCPVGEDDDSRTFGEMLPDPNVANPLERLAIEEDAASVVAALAQLTSQQRMVIEQRFWRERTLNEIGNDNGRSRERVRQIEQEALGKLRAVLGVEPPVRAPRRRRAA